MRPYLGTESRAVMFRHYAAFQIPSYSPDFLGWAFTVAHVPSPLVEDAERMGRFSEPEE